MRTPFIPRWLWLPMLLASASLSRADDGPWRFIGEATALNDGPDRALLYREKHTVNGQCEQGTWVPETDDVAYLPPRKDMAFATKQVDYSRSLLRPDFDFRQPRYGDRVTVKHDGKDRVNIRHVQGNSTETFTTPIDESVVIDAGFDNLVRQHWAALNKGESVQFEFLAPTRGEHYSFVLEPASEPEVNADVTLRIRPTGLLTKLLVDPITLGYSAQGELTDYYGLTNILKNDDSNYRAHIRYRTLQKPGCPLIP